MAEVIGWLLVVVGLQWLVMRRSVREAEEDMRRIDEVMDRIERKLAARRDRDPADWWKGEG